MISKREFELRADWHLGNVIRLKEAGFLVAAIDNLEYATQNLEASGYRRWEAVESLIEMLKGSDK